MRSLVLFVLITVGIFSCSFNNNTVVSPVKKTNTEEFIKLDTYVPALIKQESIAGVGIAVIRHGEIAWTRYYGEQAPGIPLSNKSVFNTASIAKTLSAETVIELTSAKTLDLDAPIENYVQHPDLAKDVRYAQLTPKNLMSHQAGLLNWAYSYEDGVLAFDHDPNSRFSYSGAGIELALRYTEAKTGHTLSSLAFQHVLTPNNISEMSLGVIPDWSNGRLNMPMNSEGEFRPVSELNPSLAEGNANGAADDLLTTLPAYAAFIKALINDKNSAKKALRSEILTSLHNDAIYRCPDLEWLTCPNSHGYSIGWQVYNYDDHSVIKHSGSDAGENAIVYYSPQARHGAVIFVNGANGWVVMTRIIELIGDEPNIADYYRGLLETVMNRPMPALQK